MAGLVVAALYLGRWIGARVTGVRAALAASLAGMLLISVWVAVASATVAFGMDDMHPRGMHGFGHPGMMGWMHGGRSGEEAQLPDPGGPVDAELRVEMQDWLFEPASLVATEGETVRLTVVNRDNVFHDLTVEDVPITAADGRELNRLYIPVEAGEEVSVVVTPRRAGTYELICDVPGHAAAGMVGTLVVEE